MRKLKDNGSDGVDEAPKAGAPVAASVLVSLPDDAMNPTSKGGKKEVALRPYRGRDQLPPSKKDSKGNVIGAGEPCFFVANPRPGTYDLIAVYRKRCGVGRQLAQVYKTGSKDKKKAAHAKNELAKLRAAGIPGA